MEEHLTPKKIVELLDKYIVGQKEAKKAIAIALRSRYRRQRVEGEIKDDITPKNILMIGPTGVGKTEIARRIAKITNAPFVKVEASKFTEVGYVGRDVESIIRDLARISYEIVKNEELKKVEDKAQKEAVERVLDILVPPLKKRSIYSTEEEERISKTREKFKEKLLNGELDEKIIEITINPQRPEQFVPFIEVAAAPIDELDSSLKDMIDNILPSKKKTRKVTVKEALRILKDEEAQKLIDKDKVKEKAIEKASNDGIVFIDEIDKIISKGNTTGADVSREGVQRDLLPIVEGSSVNTRYGVIKTDHILFIAAGAFHQAKPSDMIPELQGRFPIRVELKPLKKEDFIRILTEPKNALIKQYQALLETEGIQLKFSDSAIEKLAELAEKINKETENIGARRLHTLLEKLLEDISFEAPDLPQKEITIDDKYVEMKLSDIAQNRDLSRYIL
ncbi:ATP-dependent protease ATPase subunit HslU [Hippea jasoniae]|uniref:ATP-dependent protease ATPase subunit HslU n=1 Tax=Hippea jasoniae TaxID=944479 RepID=UPI00055589E5|nr:ATP-dependent protease ATPase subunit HslU [Hippea jasoniae]